MYRYHTEFVNVVSRKLLMIRISENGEKQALMEDGRWGKLEPEDDNVTVMKNQEYLEVK